MPNINEMIDQVGKAINKSPDDIQKEIKSGNGANLLNSLNPELKGQIQKMLSNPDTLMQLAKNPQFRDLIAKFMKK